MTNCHACCEKLALPDNLFCEECSQLQVDYARRRYGHLEDKADRLHDRYAREHDSPHYWTAAGAEQAAREAEEIECQLRWRNRK